MVEFASKYGFYVPCKNGCLHYQGVSPRDKKVCDFFLIAQITSEALSLGKRYAEFRVINKLRPAKTKCAKRMTDLSLVRKEQHGFTILVLNAFKL